MYIGERLKFLITFKKSFQSILITDNGGKLII